MKLIWATRGYSWGFRFLQDGGCADPLPTYDAGFTSIGEESEVWRRVGDLVVLRFADPLGRRDTAGRVIPHEFVVWPPEADEIDSVEAGRRLIWPLVADDYERVWNLPNGSTHAGGSVKPDQP